MLDATKNFDPVRAAILEAADFIEKHPKQFEFREPRMPRDCDSPGCALGWIGYFSGADLPAEKRWDRPEGVPFEADCDTTHYKGRVSARIVAEVFLHTTEGQFYNELNHFSVNWTCYSDRCAKALRLYADAYHPALEAIGQ